MKSTFPPQDREIIELLKKLDAVKADYPAELLAARRAAFIAQIEQRQAEGEKQEEYLSQDRMIELLEEIRSVAVAYPPELLAARRAAFIAQIEQRKAVEPSKEQYLSNDRMIQLLESLKHVTAEYPSELLAARRAAFIAQIEQHNDVEVQEELPSQDRVIELLGRLKSVVDDYPPELLAAKRAAFIAQIRQHNNVGVQEELLPYQNGKLSTLLRHLKSIEIEYPLKLWAARRSAFVGQIRGSGMSVLDALRTTIQSLFNGKTSFASPTSFRRTSMIIATLLVVAFMGSLLYGRSAQLGTLLEPSLSHREGAHLRPTASSRADEVAKVICKPGYLPPLCLAKEFDKSSDLTFPGNGVARPAVAKDTIPGYGRIHQPAYVNDGLYGPGASWVSNSSYSWIKIDLGEAQTINTITFGRDRLGKLNDGDPGQFVIAVALSDNIYADGNSSNDFMEYIEVYNSEEAGFDGFVSGPETVKATFDPVTARYVKITFENAGTAVDEIEVFMIQPLGFVGSPTQKPREDLPRATFTPIPTDTLIPSATATAVPPTNTSLPTNTNTPRPTNTPTEIPPTNTPIPIPTDTPEPPPTNTPEPPTDTPEPAPTNTPEGESVFPTDTPEVLGP